jgi:hypothetical protein
MVYWDDSVDAEYCPKQDAPSDADSYLHRVGRAGRFGTKGLGKLRGARTRCHSLNVGIARYHLCCFE